MIRFNHDTMMKSLLLAVVLVMGVATVAHAGEIELPPPEYDHPFSGRLIVEVVSWWDVPARCRLPRANACSWHWRGSSGAMVCHVIYPKLGTGGIDADDEVRLIRHETGHCNGWPADHPDARF